MIIPLSPRSRPHQQVTQKQIPVHNIYHFNYYYYSYRDCGKTATYCYTVPPIWHHFFLFVIIITISSVYVYVYRCKMEIKIHFTLHFTPFATWVRDALEVAYDHVRQSLKRTAARRKRLYDVKAVNRKFPVGSWVLRYYPPAAQNKLGSPWVGPQQVVRMATEPLQWAFKRIQKHLSSSFTLTT